jgi:hypothetical protein
VLLHIGPCGRRPQPLLDEGRLEAAQQPACPRPVRAAQEGEVQGAKGPPGRQAELGCGREDQGLPGIAGRRSIATDRRLGQPAEPRALIRFQVAGLLGQSVGADGDPDVSGANAQRQA